MIDALRLDDLMRAAITLPPAPRFIAGSRAAINRLIEREHIGAWVHTPGLMNAPTSIAGVQVEETAAMPAWAFALVNGNEISLYDLEYGGGIAFRRGTLPVEVDVLRGVAALRKRREEWEAAGNAPSLARDEPSPGDAPTLGTDSRRTEPSGGS